MDMLWHKMDSVNLVDLIVIIAHHQMFALIALMDISLIMEYVKHANKIVYNAILMANVLCVFKSILLLMAFARYVDPIVLSVQYLKDAIYAK